MQASASVINAFRSPGLNATERLARLVASLTLGGASALKREVNSGVSAERQRQIKESPLPTSSEQSCMCDSEGTERRWKQRLGFLPLRFRVLPADGKLRDLAVLGYANDCNRAAMEDKAHPASGAAARHC